MDEFIGVVICRGTSPGAAANRVINAGIVEAERARIIAIPFDKEAGFERYQDRLLGEEEAGDLLKTLDIPAIRG